MGHMGPGIILFCPCSSRLRLLAPRGAAWHDRLAGGSSRRRAGSVPRHWIWSPGYLICSYRTRSSPEPVCEGMYGNPIATVVPELCKVHIVLRLPRCISCHRFLFHAPESSSKSLTVQPGQHRLLAAGTLLQRGAGGVPILGDAQR